MKNETIDFLLQIQSLALSEWEGKTKAAATMGIADAVVWKLFLEEAAASLRRAQQAQRCIMWVAMMGEQCDDPPFFIPGDTVIERSTGQHYKVDWYGVVDLNHVGEGKQTFVNIVDSTGLLFTYQNPLEFELYTSSDGAQTQ